MANRRGSLGSGASMNVDYHFVGSILSAKKDVGGPNSLNSPHLEDPDQPKIVNGAPYIMPLYRQEPFTDIIDNRVFSNLSSDRAKQLARRGSLQQRFAKANADREQGWNRDTHQSRLHYYPTTGPLSPTGQREYHHRRRKDGFHMSPRTRSASPPRNQRSRPILTPLQEKKILSKIKAAAYTTIGVNWGKLFKYYDRDKSGQIGFKEFALLIRSDAKISKAMLTDRDLQAIFSLIDTDASGEIEYGEFVNWVTGKNGYYNDDKSDCMNKSSRIAGVIYQGPNKTSPTKSQQREAYRLYSRPTKSRKSLLVSKGLMDPRLDPNTFFGNLNSGLNGRKSELIQKKKKTLTNTQAKKLRSKLTAAAYREGSVDWNRLFKNCDRDNSGTVEFDEFIQLLRSDAKVSKRMFPDGDVRALFDAIDQDGSGKIDSREFLSWVFGHSQPGEAESARQILVSAEKKDATQNAVNTTGTSIVGPSNSLGFVNNSMNWEESMSTNLKTASPDDLADEFVRQAAARLNTNPSPPPPPPPPRSDVLENAQNALQRLQHMEDEMGRYTHNDDAVLSRAKKTPIGLPVARPGDKSTIVRSLSALHRLQNFIKEQNKQSLVETYIVSHGTNDMSTLSFVDMLSHIRFECSMSELQELLKTGLQKICSALLQREVRQKPLAEGTLKIMENTMNAIENINQSSRSDSADWEWEQNLDRLLEVYSPPKITMPKRKAPTADRAVASLMSRLEKIGVEL